MTSTLPAWLALAGLLGLVVGSFLNVVVHRLPRMLAAEDSDDAPGARYNLAWPQSHCPQCGHTLGPLENVPLLSYSLQRGRCRGCGTRIPVRYPLVEAAAALGAMVTVAVIGTDPQSLAVIGVFWTLLALTVIDVEHLLLPDRLTLPLLWAGLLWSVTGWTHGPDPTDAILGAAAGYLSLWTVYHGFRLATGREGMGYGDFKLTAALGAWLGWVALPVLILLAALGALLAALIPALFRREVVMRLAFGPFLALAGWVLLLVPELIGVSTALRGPTP